MSRFVPTKVIGLLDSMTLDDLDALRPVDRERFMQRCRHWAELAALPRGGASERYSKDFPVVLPRATQAVDTLAAAPAPRPAATPTTAGILGQLKRGERAT
jgi:hypothetical protein